MGLCLPDGTLESRGIDFGDPKSDARNAHAWSEPKVIILGSKY